MTTMASPHLTRRPKQAVDLLFGKFGLCLRILIRASFHESYRDTDPAAPAHRIMRRTFRSYRGLERLKQGFTIIGEPEIARY